MENQPERKAIVVVEDNKAIAELITTALNEEPDYYAVAVHDGALALDVIRSVKASLILLDVMIPGITGMQLYDMLKADPSTADTPILFLTAAKIDHVRHPPDFGLCRWLFELSGGRGRVAGTPHTRPIDLSHIPGRDLQQLPRL